MVAAQAGKNHGDEWSLMWYQFPPEPPFIKFSGTYIPPWNISNDSQENDQKLCDENERVFLD